MKLKIVSDIHTEFHRDGGSSLLTELCHGDFDAMVVAGDLGTALTAPAALNELLNALSGRPLVYVMGNHDHYSLPREQIWSQVSEIEQSSGGQLVWLNKTAVVMDSVRFIGATLWFGEHDPSLRCLMADFRAVPCLADWVVEENRLTREFLRTEVRPGDVVVTHHLPSSMSVHAKYERSVLNCFFVDDMESVIDGQKPRLWIHGHTHESMDYMLGDTRIVCNPFGYVDHGLNPDFDSSKVIEA